MMGGTGFAFTRHEVADRYAVRLFDLSSAHHAKPLVGGGFCAYFSPCVGMQSLRSRPKHCEEGSGGSALEAAEASCDQRPMLSVGFVP